MSEPVAVPSRPRILIAEDEVLIAMTLEDLLGDYGIEVVGPAATVSAALALIGAESDRLTGALLDLNLGGQKAYPVAETLAERGVPYAFLTGYGRAGVEQAFAAAPVLTKPFEMATLLRVIESFAKRVPSDTRI